LAEDIRKYFEGLEIKDPKTLTWDSVSKIVGKIWQNFENVYRQYKQLESDDESLEMQFAANFFIFIYNHEDKAKAFCIILNALAIEWITSADITILYRSGKLKYDNVKKVQNGRETCHSLSFGTSVLHGVIFEIADTDGTNPLSNHLSFPSDLYCLQLSQNKLNRYFFFPKGLKQGLAPLAAKGELSHPRLKVFLQTGDERISGIVDTFAILIMEIGAIWPRALPNIETEKQYNDKMRKLFNRHLVVIS
jgi:hypothetical protein